MPDYSFNYFPSNPDGSGHGEGASFHDGEFIHVATAAELAHHPAIDAHAKTLGENGLLPLHLDKLGEGDPELVRAFAERSGRAVLVRTPADST
jgi:hypothetical protein